MEKCATGAALNKKSHIVFDDGFDPTRSYLRLAHDDLSKEEDIVEEFCVPGQVAVVILSGGFSRELIDEIDHDRVMNTFDPQSLRGGGKSLMIRGKSSKHRRIPRGLVKIDESPVVHHWLKTLQQCQRLKPLRANVHIVCNEIDRIEFLKTVGFVKEGDGYVPLTEANVISNGATQPGEWRGDVADLQLALENIEPHRHILAISASSVVSPGHNFQRVLEHSLIRSKEILAVKRLTPTDVKLNGQRGVPIVQLEGNAESVPRIVSIAPNLHGSENEVEGVPICFLRQNRVKVSESCATGLVDMMRDFVQQGIAVHGIDLEWGHMHVDSVTWIDYSSEFFNYFAQQMKMGKKADSSRCHDDDFVLGDDVCELGRSLRLDRATMAHSIASNLEENPSLEFDRTYFAQQSTKFKGLSRPFYQTPPTFYMTAYRRLAGGVIDKDVR